MWWIQEDIVQQLLQSLNIVLNPTFMFRTTIEYPFHTYFYHLSFVESLMNDALWECSIWFKYFYWSIATKNFRPIPFHNPKFFLLVFREKILFVLIHFYLCPDEYKYIFQCWCFLIPFVFLNYILDVFMIIYSIIMQKIVSSNNVFIWICFFFVFII